MATTSGGTNANNSLTSLVWEPGGLAAADIATIAANIKDDQLGLNNGTPSNIWAGAFTQAGLLYVPNRGVLKTLPGDIVMVDTNSGWPILVSAKALALAGTPWHNG